jgi:hypothetical protein
LKVQEKVGLEFLHIELEVGNFGEIVHFLNEQHGVVLGGCHQQVVISQAHQAVQLQLLVDCVRVGIRLPWDQLAAQERTLLVLEIRVVK